MTTSSTPSAIGFSVLLCAGCPILGIGPHAISRVWAGSGAGREDESPPARLKEYGRNRGAAAGDFAAVRRAHTQERSPDYHSVRGHSVRNGQTGRKKISDGGEAGDRSSRLKSAQLPARDPHAMAAS